LLQKYKLTFHDFKEANVSINFVQFSSVLQKPRGSCPASSPLNSALLIADGKTIL
jgi:hypothetical protein